jgi:hypothetical protein
VSVVTRPVVIRAGAVLGLLASVRPSEKWQQLSLEGRQVRVGASSRNGGSLSVALAF